MADPPMEWDRSDDLPASLTGAEVGRYQVREEIGRGGMGEVYLATDTLLQRTVALKRVARKFSHDETRRQHLLREAQRASKLNDARIAAVHDVLEENGELIVVMEYVEGQSFRERMADPVDLDEFWDLAQECVKALEVAHRAGLIHRDIKPENIMLTKRGQVKILDLGLAQRRVTDGNLETLSTRSIDAVTVSGTPAYMAPEAHLGDEADERADIFSLGVFFYELLAKRRPFEGQTLAALTNQILNVDPEPLCCVDGKIPPALSWIVSKMLAKDQTQRYQSAGELLEELVAAHRGELVVQMPSDRGIRRPARRPLGALIILVALVAVLSFVLLGGPERLIVWTGLRGLPTEKHVALLPIHVGGGDEETASFAMGLTHLLTSGLSRLSDRPDLQVHSSVKTILDENVRSAREARERLGVNLALETMLEEQNSGLRAVMRLVDTESDRVLRRRKIESSLLQPVAFMKAMFHGAVDLLELPEDETASGYFTGYGTEGAGTLRFYVRGLGKLLSAHDVTDVDEALRDFRLACDTDPDNAVAKAALAEAFLRKYRTTGEASLLASAKATAEEAIRLDEQRPEGHKVLGFVHEEQGEWDLAIAEFERTLALNPTDDTAAYEIGSICHRNGDTENEEAAYQDAVERRPHYWRPYMWLAVFFYREGLFEDARRTFEKMVERAPDFYRGYLNLGGMYVLEGNYEKAIATLGKANLLRPTEGAFSNLATAYFNLRNFDRAIQTYNQAFQYNFEKYQIWINLGDAYYWAPGRRNLATDAYRHGVRLGRQKLIESPKDLWTLANLAHVYPKLGEPDSARICIEQALDGGSTNPYIQYCAAITYWQLGEKVRALDWLEKSVAGGYPLPWLRDSAVFDDWHEQERFQALIEPIDREEKP